MNNETRSTLQWIVVIALITILSIGLRMRFNEINEKLDRIEAIAGEKK